MSGPEPGDVEVAHQPPLSPELELPDYHGRKAVGMKTKLTGAGSRVSRPHEIGEKVVVVLECRAKGDGHEETDDGILYVQTLKVLDLFEVQGETGLRLLSTLRQAYRVADDTAAGRAAIAWDGDDLESAGVTDGSGVVLTKEELAELRGDPVRAMLDDATTPVVVLYSDGARELWPDDFDADATRPVAGERFRVDGEDGPTAYVYVEKLLDVSTGETLTEWTDEQENDRLVELERAAEAEEDGEARRKAEIDGKLADTAEAMAEASELDDGLEPLGTEPLEPPLPGESGPELEPLESGGNVVAFPGVAAELAEELSEPTDADFVFVDRNLPDVVADLAAIGDLSRVRRILEAEKRGHGRNLKTRKGAVDVMLSRIAALEKAEG